MEIIMEKLFIASDHAAFEQKQELIESLKNRFEMIDLGPSSSDRVNYPTFGKKIAESVLDSKGRGIALCGSGIGISIAVNRFKGIRGALCRDTEDAKMSRMHNDSNILCLGGRRNTLQEIKEIVDAWLVTEFEGGRHKTRTDMLDN
jgi:ribose 5-phosphate isomerase B